MDVFEVLFKVMVMIEQKDPFEVMVDYFELLLLSRWVFEVGFEVRIKVVA